MASVLFALSVYFVEAVTIESSNYKINCWPDESLLRSDGFKQQCTYFWNGSQSVVRDVAYCFNHTLESGKVEYFNNDSWIDITRFFRYKQISSLDKKDCYVIYNVTFPVNATLETRYTYRILPGFEKWDTLFGSVSQSRIDLLLDPLYNSTNYEIGTNRSSDYTWSGGYGFNTDLAGSDCFMNASVVSNQPQGYMKRFDGDFSVPGSLSNLTDDVDSTISEVYCGGAGCSSSFVYLLPNVSVNQVRIQSNEGSGPGFSSQSISYLRNGVWTEHTYSGGETYNANFSIPQENSTGITGLKLKSVSGHTGTSHFRVMEFYYFVNRSSISCSVISNDVNLSLNAATAIFKVYSSGNVSLNITGDGNLSNGVYFTNASSNSTVSFLTSVSSNNKLKYYFFLNDNSSFIQNFTLQFTTTNNSPAYVNSWSASPLSPTTAQSVTFLINVTSQNSILTTACALGFFKSDLATPSFSVQTIDKSGDIVSKVLTMNSYGSGNLVWVNVSCSDAFTNQTFNVTGINISISAASTGSSGDSAGGGGGRSIINVVTGNLSVTPSSVSGFAFIWPFSRGQATWKTSLNSNVIPSRCQAIGGFSCQVLDDTNKVIISYDLTNFTGISNSFDGELTVYFGSEAKSVPLNLRVFNAGYTNDRFPTGFVFLMFVIAGVIYYGFKK